jgi:hypothetical protein
MSKFQALWGVRSLYIPWIERNPETGAITKDQGITFNNGLNTRTGHVPAYLYSESPDLVKFLRDYPGNSANGGQLFEEVKEPKEKAVIPTAKPEKKAAAPEPTPEPETELVTVFTVADPSDDETESITEKAPKESNIKEYPEATIVQQAFMILKGLDNTVNTGTVRTRADVHKKAETLNISFPNL